MAGCGIDWIAVRFPFIFAQDCGPTMSLEVVNGCVYTHKLYYNSSMCLALYTRHARLCAQEDAQTHHTTFARASRTRTRIIPNNTNYPNEFKESDA